MCGSTERTYRSANLRGWKPERWWWSPGRLALARVAAARPARCPRQAGCCPTGSMGSRRSVDPARGGLLWNWLHRPPPSLPGSLHYPCRFTPRSLWGFSVVDVCLFVCLFFKKAHKESTAKSKGAFLTCLFYSKKGDNRHITSYVAREMSMKI